MKEVVGQMEKDLALSGHQFQFSSLSSEDLIKELFEMLMKVDKRGQLNNLLYRVDINPSAITEHTLDGLAELIWNRELKKVLFRKMYSKQATPTVTNPSLKQ